MRKRLLEIIDVGAPRPFDQIDWAGRFYDYFMLVSIAVSILPLMAKQQDSPLFLAIDRITVIIFILDYLLRWITADLRMGKGRRSFLLHPFTPFAIIDLVAILPSLTVLNNGLKVFRILRMMRSFRAFRLFKAMRYSRSILMISNVFRKQRDSLMVVGGVAMTYILVSALTVFNVEPDSFPTFFDAVYWATITLTTVGYGDFYAVTPIGKALTMISSIFGVAVVALPAGIITAGYMDELREQRHRKEAEKKAKKKAQKKAQEQEAETP